MKCAVTGGTGFLGSHLVDALIADDAEVTVLVRRTSDLKWLSGKPLTTAEVPLNDVPALTKALTGCDVVFHVAGLTHGSSKDAFFEANVETTRRILEACKAAAAMPGRLVLVSSLAAAGPSLPGRPRNEAMTPVPIGVYGESKALAEQLLRREGDGGIEWAIVQPGPIYGPRDRDVLMVLEWAARGLRMVPGLKHELNFAHVKDVVQAVCLAATVPEARGETFLVGGPRNVTGAEAAAAFGRAVDRPGLTLPMPGPMVWAAASAFELAGRLTGVKPIMGFDKAREITAGSWAMDISKARDILGYRPEWDLEPGLRQTVAWYRTHGWM